MESIFCLLCPANPLFSVHLPLTPSFSLLLLLLSVERNALSRLKHIKPFTSLSELSVILFLTSQESPAQRVSTGRGEELLVKEENLSNTTQTGKPNSQLKEKVFASAI